MNHKRHQSIMSARMNQIQQENLLNQFRKELQRFQEFKKEFKILHDRINYLETIVIEMKMKCDVENYMKGSFEGETQKSQLVSKTKR